MKRRKNVHWMALYFIVGTLDFIQLVIIEGILVWFFGIGAIINEILDPIVGGLLAIYLQLKGVSLISRPARLLSLVGVEAAAVVTGGIAQLWILDVWYIHHDVKKEEAEINALLAKQELLKAKTGPLNENGMRKPRPIENEGESTPLNVSGIRAPSAS